MSKSLVADLIIYGGTIHSMDEDKSSPEAIAVADGRIIGVGAQNDIFATHAGAETILQKLKDGQALLPGFIEPHSHCAMIVKNKCYYVSCSAYECSNYEEVNLSSRCGP